MNDLNKASLDTTNTEAQIASTTITKKENAIMEIVANKEVSVKEKLNIALKEGNIKENAHINDEKLIAEMTGKGKLKNFTVQKIVIAPSKYGISAKLDIVSIQETPINTDYIKKDVTLTSVIGTKTVVKQGSDKIVIVDFSAINNPVLSQKQRLSMARFIFREFYLAEVDGKIRVLIDISDSDTPKTSFFDIVSQKHYDKDALYTKKGNLKRKVQRFSGDYAGVLYTPSQNRQKETCMYANTSKADIAKYKKALSEAQLGQDELTMKLVKNGAWKDIANSVSRSSQKATRMNMTEHGPRNYIIVLGKDNNSDGSFDLSSRCVAESIIKSRDEEITEKKSEGITKLVNGYLIQARPYLIKGAGVVHTQEGIDKIASNFNVLRIDINDTSKKDIIKAVQLILNKTTRDRAGVKFVKSDIIGMTHVLSNLPKELEGYNAVMICHDGIEAPIDMIGDLNAFKDFYDLKQTDGLCVMAIAHAERNDFQKVSTTGQFNKIPLAAVKACPELRGEYEEIMKEIIRHTIDMDTVIEVRPKQFGAEMLDINYISGLVKDLNPNNLDMFPEILKGVISDTICRIEKHIKLDSYKLDGHYGMLTVDLAYKMFGKSLLKQNGDFWEVYDPHFNRYAEECGANSDKGVFVKYPCMGTREFLPVKYISEEEMIKRAKELAGDEADILINEYLNLKEGCILLPIELGYIAKICSGLDEDGDRAGFLFDAKDKSLAQIIIKAVESGKFLPRPVDIDTNGPVKKATIDMNDQMHQKLFYEQLSTDNKSVGIITNNGRIFSEGLLIADDDEVGKKFYCKLISSVFETGFGKYISPIKVENGVYYTTFDIVERITKAISKAAITWENIKLILDDFDVVFRHLQELTIDAAKKFYVVLCAFIDKMRNKFSILPLKYKINFDVDFEDNKNNKTPVTIISNDGYYVKKDGWVEYAPYSIIEHEDANGMITEEYVIADAFARFRVYAANYALTKLLKLRQRYIDAKANEKYRVAMSVAYENLIMRKGKEACAKLDHVVKLGRHANTVYGNYINALKEEYITDSMTEGEKVKRLTAIRKEANAKFSSMLDNVSNELRCVAEEYGFSAKELVLFISQNKSVVSGVLGRFLKEETCYSLAASSEIKQVCYEITNGADVVAIGGFDYVTVNNGEIVETGTRVNLMNGEYKVNVNVNIDHGETVSLTRPLTDYIELPKADHTKLTFGLELKDVHVFDEIESGSKLTIKKIKNEKGYDTVAVFDEEGHYITNINCGAFSHKEKDEKNGKEVVVKDKIDGKFTFHILMDMYINKTGVLSNIDISDVTKDGKRYGILTLSNVENIEVEEVKAVKFVRNRNNDSLDASIAAILGEVA